MASVKSNLKNYPHFKEIELIIERTLQLNRSTYEVMRILGSSLLAKDNLKDLFQPVEVEQINDDWQLQLDF